MTYKGFCGVAESTMIQSVTFQKACLHCKYSNKINNINSLQHF